MSRHQTMSTLHRPSRWLGLDLLPLWCDLLAAWRGMLAWPILAWLQPKMRVRLWLPSGQAVSSHGPDTPVQADNKQLKAARFDAILLPEHLLLRSMVNLPLLPDNDMQAALSLHSTGLSPFPADDLVWMHEPAPHASTSRVGVPVHLVLASRRLIAKYLQQVHPEINAATTEVWLPSALGQHNVMLPGFGQATRLRQLALWRWVCAGLVLCALLLLSAMVLTPTAQLYVRAHQAQASITALQQTAAPVLQQRASLTHATEQLVNLTEIASKSIPPLQVLKRITDALPDDTAVLSLQTQGFKVSLSGQTTDTTALMKHLSTIPGLRDVTAPTAATKPLGAPRESFTIEFTLDAAQPQPAPVQPTAPTPAQ